MFLKKIMNGQFLPRKNPAKTVKGRGFLDRGLMNIIPTSFPFSTHLYICVSSSQQCL